jgi:hypothetical protein
MAFNQQQDPEKPAAGTKAPTEGDGGPDLDLQSSKQLAAAGIEIEDWKAKYDGIVGSTKQLVKKHQAALAAKESRIAELEQEVETLSALKPQAEQAAELQKQLDVEKATGAALDLKTKKQDVLLQYPVLTAPTKDGKPNPLLEVLMASNLEPEAFATKAAELAALDWAQQAGQNLGRGATPPPPPPQGGGDTPDAWQAKAMAAHEKFVASGRKDKAAQQEEAEAWAEYGRLTRK